MTLQTKKFQKKVEDFTCEHCGREVKGTGYTNHCPQCLWSKHVDVNPGDRAEGCGGMMKPITIEVGKAKYMITHRCERCGVEKKNRMETMDNFDEALRIIKEKNQQTK